MTAFAAGWEQQNGAWIFTDASNNRVTNSWRQSGNYYFYLDYNGVMATDRWIDDTYYVDVNGVRITDRWIYVQPGNHNSPNPDGGWFYLDSGGRAVTDGWRTINNQRYHFDTDGTMQYGWLDENDNLYYLGDEHDGAMKTGWLALDYDEDDRPETGDVSAVVSSGTMGKWFYFQENGRAVKASGSDSYVNRTINGYRYYFDNRGVPAYLNSEADTLSDATTRINGQSYFFDEYGRMQSGLLGFRTSDGTILSAYFGSNDSDGSMKRDRQTNVIDDDGSRGTFFFISSGTNRGAGYTGERSGYLYYNGKLVEAEDGEDFQVFRIGETMYLVNESGRVQDSNRFYRVDGEYRYEYDNGTIYYVNRNRQRIGEVTRSERLPEIDYRAIYNL